MFGLKKNFMPAKKNDFITAALVEMMGDFINNNRHPS
jgi:hypothetical protein